MNTSGVGRLLSLAGRLGRAFNRKEFVGTDRSGNSYFRWKEKTYEGEWMEKRTCEFHNDDYDPTSIPPIWKSWLQGARREPPTDEDQRIAEQRADELKAKVSAIEAEEKQRSFKAKSLQDVGQEDHSAAAMTSLLGGNIKEKGGR